MLFGQPSQIVRLRILRLLRLHTPKVRRLSVWALPRSLAATWGISVDFFSSGYLDVSVHRVNSLSGDGISSAGLPHSGIRESLPACGSSRLFAAFRALLRPNTPGHPPCALGSFTFHTFLPSTSVDDKNPNVFLLFPVQFSKNLLLVVGLGRLELPTSRLSGVRSNRLSYRPFGDEEIRTPDPLLAKQVLSQLSYAPSARLPQNQAMHLPNALLRKEVIQPHLPIRLPCYDFTPVIAPALGLLQGLRV